MKLSVKPEDWFLKDRGNPDSKISLYTKGNRVEPLIDGRAYMKKIYDLLTSAGENDFFYYVGWHLDLGLVLDPSDTNDTVLTAFNTARANKVDARVMLSGHLTHKNGPAIKAFRKPGEQGRRIQCMVDARVRSLGSAHQKFSVLYTDRSKGALEQQLPSKRLYAFCGGIDLAFDRWDDNSHIYAASDTILNANPKPDTRLPRFARQFVDYNGGWHDVHALIEGPACIDLYVTFLERWNNPNPLLSSHKGYYSTVQQRDLTAAAPEIGTHFVQVLRTYSCGYTVGEETPGGDRFFPKSVTYPFALKGEDSARKACLQAIKMAQYYIYIEDQYFFSSEISDALQKALANKPDLRVIVLVAQDPKADKGHIHENYYHGRVCDSLKANNRFAVYDLVSTIKKPEQIYVHAKLMIVDDVWVEIGSMNCNRRSMTHDMEAAIAVVDSETQEVEWGDNKAKYMVCKFAHELRLRLWAEHLGMSSTEDSAIQDPHKGFDEWKNRTESNLYVCHAHRHTPAKGKASALLWNDFIDPQGTCPEADKIPAP
jgi:phosphatidylserine/phosphatidylglycerophosphate/cardiolipin synthase-like enzyme